jgi:hypothetical protein
MTGSTYRYSLTYCNLAINRLAITFSQCTKNPLAVQQNRCRLRPGILTRRILVKKTYLSIAAVAAVLMAGGTAGLAAELPTYEVTGFPISVVQAQVLGAADARERLPVMTSAASPHQPGVLTTAAVAAARPETGRSIR